MTIEINKEEFAGQTVYVLTINGERQTKMYSSLERAEGAANAHVAEPFRSILNSWSGQ